MKRLLTLRSFLILVSLSVIAVIMGAFYFQTQSIIGKVFSELNRLHEETITQTVQSMVETKIYGLRTYRGLLENDNSLSSKVIMAAEHHSPQLILPDLARLSTKYRVDFVDVLYHGKTSFSHPELGLGSEIGGKATSGFRLFEVSGQPVLVSYSPLRNYGEVIGTLILGYQLNGSLLDEISHATRTAVKFLGPRSPTVSGSLPVSVEGVESPEGTLRVTLDGGLISHLGSHTRGDITIVGVISFGLILVLLYLLLEFGFVRQFKKLLQSIHSVALSLDKGDIEEYIEVSHPIREVAALSQSFAKFSRSLKQFETKVQEKSRKEAFVEVAEQVAHDIKSPLSALDMMLSESDLAGVPDKRRGRIRECIQRIKDTLRVLSEKRLPSTSALAGLVVPTSPSAVVETIVSEKRIQYRNRTDLVISSDTVTGYGLFCAIAPNDLKRLLSNLIDNSVQATHDGYVGVSVAEEASQIELVVEDSGTGIPKELLPKLALRGNSFGKSDGSGLGLWNAKEVISSYGGSLSVSSEVGVGTIVTIRIPKVSAPCWFVPSLEIPVDATIVIVDDSPTIHEIWKKRLHSLGITHIEHFSGPHSFFSAMETRRRRPFLCLIDYELGAGLATGLDVITRLSLEAGAILVTGHAGSLTIQQICTERKIRLIAKDLIDAVPLRVTQAMSESQGEPS